LIPAFAKTSARLRAAAARSGTACARVARKFGIEEATTDVDSLFAREDIDAVVIATRHDSHAELVCRSLRAGKHIFVEKPLALTTGELDEITDAYDDACQSGSAPLLMVGFNRRFAPQVARIVSLLSTVREPKAFVMTVNAGQLPPDHWTHDRSMGGGRIVGEGCHFVDLLRHLAGHPIVSLQAAAMGGGPASHPSDRVTLTLCFADGSLGTVHYLSNGHRRVAKERLEIFAGGRSLQLDNFRRLRGFGWNGFRKMNLWRQVKGHDLEAQAFVRAIETGSPAPIPFEQLIEVSRVVLDVEKALETGDRIRYASGPPSLACYGGFEAASVGA
jgi:predicted dehydrogenase